MFATGSGNYRMNLVDDLSLASVIGKLHPLPSPRGAALELLRLSQVENSSVGDIAHVVQADPVLAGKLIHAALYAFACNSLMPLLCGMVVIQKI